jgi:hypothetical protein
MMLHYTIRLLYYTVHQHHDIINLTPSMYHIIPYHTIPHSSPPVRDRLAAFAYYIEKRLTAPLTKEEWNFQRQGDDGKEQGHGQGDQDIDIDYVTALASMLRLSSSASPSVSGSPKAIRGIVRMNMRNGATVEAIISTTLQSQSDYLMSVIFLNTVRVIAPRPSSSATPASVKRARLH